MKADRSGEEREPNTTDPSMPFMGLERMDVKVTSAKSPVPGKVLEVFHAFLMLGLTSFGGPVAHIGYFRRELVQRRAWLTESTFMELVGICQLLPGPASSQVGFAIGLLRAGWLGAAAAWTGFTLPSVLLMLVFAALTPKLDGWFGQGLTHGLKLAAVVVVAQAVWDMARALCSDHRRAGIALVGMALLAVVSTSFAQILVIAVGAGLGAFMCQAPYSSACNGGWQPSTSNRTRAAGAIALLLFAFLFIVAVTVHSAPHGRSVGSIFSAFYRSGALVFGGGHIVLPLLQQQTVATGWVSENAFITGYGAAQIVPGPLFSFASFLGFAIGGDSHRWSGVFIATVSIFLPGLLLVIAILPFWGMLRSHPVVKAMFVGMNASVVALLATALYSQIWVSTVKTNVDFAAAVIGFVLATRWRVAPVYLVIGCATLGIVAALPVWAT